MIKQVNVKQPSGRSIAVWLVISLFFICGTSSYLGYISYNKYQDILVLQDKIRQLTEATATLGDVYQTKKESLKYQNELQSKIKKMSQLARLNRQAPAKLLNELSQLIPDEVVVESLSIEKKNVEIKGMALSTQDIMLFLDKLEESSHFKQPGLLTLGSAPQETQYELIPFTITAVRAQ